MNFIVLECLAHEEPRKKISTQNIGKDQIFLSSLNSLPIIILNLLENWVYLFQNIFDAVCSSWMFSYSDPLYQNLTQVLILLHVPF